MSPPGRYCLTRRTFLRTGLAGLAGLTVWAIHPSVAGAETWTSDEEACATCNLWQGERTIDYSSNEVVVAEEDMTQTGRCLRNYRLTANPDDILYTLPDFLCQFYVKSADLP